MSEPVVLNPSLYEKAKEEVYERYKKPSAYRSMALVKKYKELGGKYGGDKEKGDLYRWKMERWKDVGGMDYPVYRPTYRITEETPLTKKEIDPTNLKRQIYLKQRIRGMMNLPPFKRK